MPVFGLIDGNSFYCSAERAFAPELRGLPLVVLSNNDGCAIARTSEAKALGIKMGEPWHLALRRPECKPVEWRSSNYPLYGDMSRRMYEVLTARVPQVEPYSIDVIWTVKHWKNILTHSKVGRVADVSWLYLLVSANICPPAAE